jgi:hypothetical protein
MRRWINTSLELYSHCKSTFVLLLFVFLILSLLTVIYVLFFLCFLLFIYWFRNLVLGTFFGDLPETGAAVGVGGGGTINSSSSSFIIIIIIINFSSSNSSISSNSTEFSPTSASLVELFSD